MQKHYIKASLLLLHTSNSKPHFPLLSASLSLSPSLNQEKNMDHSVHRVSVKTQSRFLRMVFKILVPVSVFSFIISRYSSLFLPLPLSSVDEFSSSFSVNHLFRGYKSERNYMFLVCNGILGFILKNSGLIAKPPPCGSNPKLVQVRNHEEEEEEEEEMKRGSDDERVTFTNHHHQEEDEEEERKEEDDERVICSSSDHHHHHQDEEEAERVNCSDHDHHHQEEDDDEEEREICSDHHHQEEDEENEVGDGIGSKEEFNKKCDEFIKKMKQAIIMRN